MPERVRQVEEACQKHGLDVGLVVSRYPFSFVWGYLRSKLVISTGLLNALEEALSRAEFTDRIENFFEYAPLKSGKTSQFLIHLTDLADGSVAVLSGLQAGERIVTQGALQLKLQELKPAGAGAHSHET